MSMRSIIVIVFTLLMGLTSFGVFAGNRCCCIYKQVGPALSGAWITFTNPVNSCKSACKRGALVKSNDKCLDDGSTSTKKSKWYKADNGCPAGKTLSESGNDYSCS